MHFSGYLCLYQKPSVYSQHIRVGPDMPYIGPIRYLGVHIHAYQCKRSDIVQVLLPEIMCPIAADFQKYVSRNLAALFAYQGGTNLSDMTSDMNADMCRLILNRKQSNIGCDIVV